MKKSALNLAPEEDPAFAESAPAVPKLHVSKIIVYQPERSALHPIAKRPFEHTRRRRRKLARLIKLEAAAFFLLVLTLAGATSEPLQNLGYQTLFQVGIFISALAVALVPVILYGLPRQRYGYSARRSRSR